MPKVPTEKKTSPRRVPHAGRRPKARVIGPDVLCAQPKPPRKPRVKRPPAIVSGPPIVSAAPVSSSAVRSMASSLAAAKSAAARRILKEEADALKTMDMLQSMMFFIAAAAALFLDKAGLAVSLMALETFVPMLIRRGIAKWRDRLMP